MPRKPDPGLGAAILNSALQLVDDLGVHAVTMREVARRAHTSTPTLYERFYEREALLWALVEFVQVDLYRCVSTVPSLAELSAVALDYGARYPGRLELMNEYWPRLLSSDRPKPNFEAAKKKFMEELRYSEAEAEEATHALTALLIGTAMLMRNAEPSVAASMRAAALRAARDMCRKPGA